MTNCLTLTPAKTVETPAPVRILLAGVDTLLVNFKLAGEDDRPNGELLPDEAIAQLDAWQALARKEHEAVPTDLVFSYTIAEQTYEETLMMRPHGSGVFSWLLFCDALKLSLSYGTLNGGVFAQARFSSHLLWQLGPEHAIVECEATLYALVGQMIYQQASEIHLCADLQGFDFSEIDWQHCFISRVVRIRERPDVPEECEQSGGLSPAEECALEARIQESIREGGAADLADLTQYAPCYPFPTTVHRRLATLDFGSHGSNISAQLYNKSLEIKKHEKQWFIPMYEVNGYDPALPVWRWEIRIKRKFLAERDLNNAFETLAQLRALWLYATTLWLRMVDLSAPSTDSNKSRLPTHPVWLALQEAFSLPAADLDAPLEEPQTDALRLAYLRATKPERLLEAAATLPAVERLTDAESRLADARAASWDGLYDAPAEVVRDVAANYASLLTHERRIRLILLLAPSAASSDDAPSALARLIERNPFEVIAHAATVEQYEEVSALTHVYTQEMEAIRATCAELAPADKEAVLDELLSARSPEEVHVLVEQVWASLPFVARRDQQAVLIKRSRRMARIDRLVPGLTGYLSSLAAVTPDDMLTFIPGGGHTADRAPNLLTTMLYALQKVRAYNEKKRSSHIERVYQKRLYAGFVTAAELEEQRRLYGLDLQDGDFTRLYQELDRLASAARSRSADTSSTPDVDDAYSD